METALGSGLADTVAAEAELTVGVATAAVPAAAAAATGSAVPLEAEGLRGGPIVTGGPVRDCGLLRHTFRDAPQCELDQSAAAGPGPSSAASASGRRPHLYPLLVTGVGRSATKFMQESLVALGAQVSHDNTEVGRHGAVAWPLAVRETGHLDPHQHGGCNGYELPSFLHNAASAVVGPDPRARFANVFHQVSDRIGSPSPPFFENTPKKKSQRGQLSQPPSFFAPMRK
jgi:hypothetical protein